MSPCGWLLVVLLREGGGGWCGTVDWYEVIVHITVLKLANDQGLSSTVPLKYWHLQRRWRTANALIAICFHQLLEPSWPFQAYMCYQGMSSAGWSVVHIRTDSSGIVSVVDWWPYGNNQLLVREWKGPINCQHILESAGKPGLAEPWCEMASFCGFLQCCLHCWSLHSSAKGPL